MPEDKKTLSVSIALGEDDLLRIKALSDLTGMSRSEVVRHAISLEYGVVLNFLELLKEILSEFKAKGEDLEDPTTFYKILAKAMEFFSEPSKETLTEMKKTIDRIFKKSSRDLKELFDPEYLEELLKQLRSRKSPGEEGENQIIKEEGR